MDDELKRYFEGVIEKSDPKRIQQKKERLRNSRNFRIKVGGKNKLNKTVFKIIVLNKMKNAKEETLRRKMTYIGKRKSSVKSGALTQDKSGMLSLNRAHFLCPKRTENLEKFLNNSPTHRERLRAQRQSPPRDSAKPKEKGKELFMSKVKNNEIDLLNPEMFRFVQKTNLLKKQTATTKNFRQLVLGRDSPRPPKQDNYFVKKHFFGHVPQKYTSLKNLHPIGTQLRRGESHRSSTNWPFFGKMVSENIRTGASSQDRNKTSELVLKKQCTKREFEKKLDSIVRMQSKQKRAQSSNEYQQFISKLNRKYSKKSTQKNRLLQNTPFGKMGSISLKSFTNKNYEVFKSLFKGISVRRDINRRTTFRSR